MEGRTNIADIKSQLTLTTGLTPVTFWGLVMPCLGVNFAIGTILEVWTHLIIFLIYLSCVLLRLSPVSYLHSSLYQDMASGCTTSCTETLRLGFERNHKDLWLIYGPTCLKGGGKLSKFSSPREITRNPRFSALTTSAKRVTKRDLLHKQYNSATWRETHTTGSINTLWHKTSSMTQF